MPFLLMFFGVVFCTLGLVIIGAPLFILGLWMMIED